MKNCAEQNLARQLDAEQGAQAVFGPVNSHETLTHSLTPVSLLFHLQRGDSNTPSWGGCDHWIGNVSRVSDTVPDTLQASLHGRPLSPDFAPLS